MCWWRYLIKHGWLTSLLPWFVNSCDIPVRKHLRLTPQPIVTLPLSGRQAGTRLLLSFMEAFKKIKISFFKGTLQTNVVQQAEEINESAVWIFFNVFIQSPNLLSLETLTVHKCPSLLALHALIPGTDVACSHRLKHRPPIWYGARMLHAHIAWNTDRRFDMGRECCLLKSPEAADKLIPVTLLLKNIFLNSNNQFWLTKSCYLRGVANSALV